MIISNFEHLGSPSDNEFTVVRPLKIYEPLDSIGTNALQTCTMLVISISIIAVEFNS